MSRSSHQLRQQQKQQMLAQQQLIADNEAAAAAAEMFDLFCVATTMRQVLGLHRNMCDLLGLRPAPLNEFYPKVKAKVRSWKAQALWKKFDARAAHRAYAKGTACTGSRVLVIGAGPCGLRTAIEAQLLGAKVLVVEKRDRISRNNVLHLWPFVITDLRNLGAKKFYGKFCAGSIDHISIRQLQCILLKVALLLGVEVHEGVSFEHTIEPSGDGCGWRASVLPADHAVSHYEFDVLIGADGKRNTLEGFKRKEFRGKLAIAITANFINKKTEAEAKVEEISGVAFIFNQSFFKELYHTTGIDLENIVYYKDETHYFVMTAKKHSLIDKGVIMQDFADPAELLASSNVNTEKLLDYAREAAEFSTKYQMPNLEFAVNHYGKPDVAMFDFTSMFASETSCRVIVRKGFRLMQCLVGDSLLEPFWPTGSGCARGFLSSMDAAYALKLWTNSRNSILGVLAQRESIYRLLNQTTPENLQRDIGSYTVDPATRYPNLNRTSVNVWQVKHLIDTDDVNILEQTFMDTNALQTAQVDTPIRRKRRSGDSTPLSTVLLRWICAQLHAYEFVKDLKEVSDVFTNGKVLCALINRYRPDLVDFSAVKDLSPVECNERAFKILEKEMHIPRIMSGKDSIQLSNVDAKMCLNYLEQICEVFRGEVPHVKHPKMDFTELREKYRINYARTQPDFSKLLQISSSNKSKSKSPQDLVDVPQNVQRSVRSVLTEEQLKRQRGIGAGTGTGTGASAAVVAAASGSGLQPQVHNETPRRAKKRRSAEKAANIAHYMLKHLTSILKKEFTDPFEYEEEERQQRLLEIESNRHDRQSRRRQQRYLQTQNFYKSLHMLHANTLLRESDENTPFEDYSIFLYRQQAPEFNDRVKDLERKLLYPDRDRGDIQSALPRGATDDQFSDRIKSMEQRMAIPRNSHGVEKKPKDLMRAIGKIESSDWNVREIERKIEQSRKTEVHGPKGREKVPKWSREQFQARQKKMAKPARQESVEEKFKEIDQTLKNFDKQLKEGSILEVGERGRNKVASIAGQFFKKDESNTNSDEKNPSNTVVPKSSSKVALAFKKQAASEKCHFCKQTVYLMEKITAEGLILHRSCLKCHHCHTNLRQGGYAFDRDDPNGRFYCTQHFRLPAKAMPRPAVRKPGQRKSSQQQQQQKAAVAPVVTSSSTTNTNDVKTPEKLRVHTDNVAQLDLLDRGQTPERIEFENTDAMSDGEPSEEHIIDEHEWSGRNFLPESNNDSESDLSSSDESDTDSDSDMFEEAAESPIGAQTLQLVTDWIGKQNYTDSDDSDEFYDSSDGAADDGKDDTEGEEFKKARELRREEVRLMPLPPNLPTDTETEAKLLNENNKENIKTGSKENVENLNENNKENVKTASNENSNQNVEDLNKNNKENARTASNNQTSNSNLNLQEDAKNSFRKGPRNSFNSDKSFESAHSMPDESLTQSPTVAKSGSVTKTDIEKLEQNSNRKFSAEIDAISEKLFRLNSMVKMNKDLETLAKENLVKSDILKKLTLKEKWLADNKVGNSNETAPKSRFEDKFEKLMKKPNESVPTEPKVNNENKRDKWLASNAVDPASSTAPKSKFDDKFENIKNDSQNLSTTNLTPNLNANKVNPSKLTRNDSNRSNKKLSPRTSPNPRKKPIANASRSNSFKSNASTSSSKASKVSQQPIEKDNKMQLENILDVVKKIDISSHPKVNDNVQKKEQDLGSMFYNAEHHFSPKPDKRMTAKLKEIQAQSFSGTLDTIKSQIVEPTVSTGSTVDLSKYFPNQRQEKATASSINKNQKNLKDVDLAKYFPASPVPQRRNAVETVADKLKKSQTTQAIAKPSTSQPKEVTNKNAPLKRQLTDTSAGGLPSLRDHQLDGAVDLSKKITPLKIKTTTTAATTAKKGIKIIKKIVPKGTKAKKSSEPIKKNINSVKKKNALDTRDEADRILDEILVADGEAIRSPSIEYQHLFNEEKSPSDDISDKIERILEETGIDLGIPGKDQQKDKYKRLLKTKSLGEGDFKLKPQETERAKELGDRPSGVQSLLKRFESMSSVKSDASSNSTFKLQRMESTTSNLNQSRESLKSRESLTISDLEKTMEYLKSEWRNEATNFLQKKRDNYFGQKRAVEEEKANKIEEQKKTRYEVPVQYRESKFAKFFGLKAKSPEKAVKRNKTPEKIVRKNTPERNQVKTPINKKAKTPEKKLTATPANRKKSKSPKPLKKEEKAKPISKPTKPYNSLEELALLSALKQGEQKNKKSFTETNEKFIEKVTKKPIETNKSKEIVNEQLSNDKPTTEKNTTSGATETLVSSQNNKIIDVNRPTSAIDSSLEIRAPVDPDSVSCGLVSNDVNAINIDNTTEQRPQRVEDIKNLPKTGCDKSQNSSRRSSLASLQSRRQSDISLEEKIEVAISELAAPGSTEISKMEFDTMDNKSVNIFMDDECDSLCTTISKSPSVAPVTVQLRHSSEDESIEKLFSQFSDEMLVDVEFDSNDELVAITPVVDLAKTELGDHKHNRNLDLKENSNLFALSSHKTENESQFPLRPQRRQKSSSTSSEKTSSELTTPTAPTRLKKKLNRICPTDMAPSVQDVLNHLNPEEPLNYAVPKKFPRTVDESDQETDKSSRDTGLPVETVKIEVKTTPIECDKKVLNGKVVAATEAPKLISSDKTQNGGQKPIASTNTSTPLSSSSLSSVRSTETNKVKLNSLPGKQVSNSSTPSQGSSTSLGKNLVNQKAASKEKSLEWDMEKLPNSPMPRNRFVHPERAPYKEIKLRELSPTSSIKLLNNLSQNSSDSDEANLRKALIERDKAYDKLEKPKIVPTTPSRESSIIQKVSTPVSMPPKPTPRPTPRSSRASTQEISTANRCGTPPMLKILEIPTEAPSPTTSRATSRHNSFAFIELLDNSNPIIAPMPKKLEIPNTGPKFVPEINNDLAKEEIFQNRPWPRPELDYDDYCSSPEPSKQETLQDSRTPSPVPEIFKGRHWPDGKTDFSKLEPPNKVGTTSKSYNDLRRSEKTAPHEDYTKLNNSTHSLHTLAPARSTRSSADFEQASNLSSTDSGETNNNIGNWLATPQRPPTQHTFRTPPVEEMDASTRLLLDRGKRLHNRKRDFINERVAERNPYMKDFIEEERTYPDTVEDELDGLRPKHYTSSRVGTITPRFPTANKLSSVRSSRTPYYDYTSPPRSTIYTPSTVDYGTRASSRASIYGPSLPLGSSLAYQNLPTTSTYGLSGDRSFLGSYTRRSPFSTTSQTSRDRNYLKDSCVQSESESSSPDKIELNSATEISTDSEFDHDELTREAPKIFIDDTHTRKPTKVQVKSTIIEATTGFRIIPSTHGHAKVGGSYLAKYQIIPPQPQFKPLVQVDPTLLNTNRAPLQNPRPGDYLLNKTASTEGIASKKSLELKKRYLLGEQSNGNKIQKSGSTSVLDSRIRSFQSNISECQKLLNPGSDISPSMKTFLDRTRLGENSNELMRSATSNIINDLKVEITIQKASSAGSTDNEKENVFVNSKNELNKGMEYSETINIALMDNMVKKNSPSPTTPTNKEVVIETIDLTTPEKPSKVDVIDLTTPEKQDLTDTEKSSMSKHGNQLLTSDSNKLTDSTCESPLKSEHTIVEEIQLAKPDVSKDAKHNIPDILDHVGKEKNVGECNKAIDGSSGGAGGDRVRLLSNSDDEEKMDSPEKHDEQFENDAVQIEVPNIPWNTHKKNNASSTTNSSWSSSTSTSIEDIQHYILESTTSPDTNNTNGLSVPRVEVHDSSGTLMQVDSLMIVDGKYIGDPEDLKYMEVPAGVVLPEEAAVKTTEIDEDIEHDAEPITATPEPVEQTVIEQQQEIETPTILPTQTKPISAINPKFDTKNEYKLESLKHLPLIVEQSVEHTKAIKPVTLNLHGIPAQPIKTKTQKSPTTPTELINCMLTPTTPLDDNDKTPTAELLSRGSDSETEPTGTGQVMTETELSDWTADDCISENFIDAEFVLNSNKGTMKRNKKNKRRNSGISNKLPSTSEVLKEVVRTAPVVDIESMFNTIDIEDIEFMDTGSEGSCAEAYSATNTALLRNRGYIEFIEHKPKSNSQKTAAETTVTLVPTKQLNTKRDEKLGIDYIEQGAYLLQDDRGEVITPDQLKTPVNETMPSIEPSVGYQPRRQSQSQIQTYSIMTQSLTDSSTLNELEDDSLGIVTANSQTVTSVTSKPATTTEESDALTVVTSPMDSPSAKIQDVNKEIPPSFLSKDNETPSSSEKNPKSTQSACTPTTASTGMSSKSATPPAFDYVSAQRKATATTGATLEEQLSYEEYVRALQQKIEKISTAGLRDSLDSRKQRRKSSKGEAPALNATPTVIEQPINKAIVNKSEMSHGSNIATTSIADYDALPPATSVAVPAPQIHKVPEIPTLTRKLEEITKERTKQKDLIHDLVMDKLQSKKQLNAEKRLHRSRQRQLLTSGGGNGGYSSGSSLSPTPKIVAPITVTDGNCTDKAHYHVSTASTSPSSNSMASSKYAPNSKENVPQQFPPYVAAYTKTSNNTTNTNTVTPSAQSAATVATAYRHRPFSAHLDNSTFIEPAAKYKLQTTQSFSYVSPTAETYKSIGDSPTHNITVSTVLITPKAADKLPTSMSTENLRSEARARARLKSNSELGLSPEEKMNLLRQRLYAEHIASTNKMTPLPIKNVQSSTAAREHKMSASKSVNDLAYICGMRATSTAGENSNTKSNSADFTSDPNLLLSSQQTTPEQAKSNTNVKTKTNRRHKDPERRKSLIQSISSLFHKEKKPKSQDGNGSSSGTTIAVATGALNSAQTERPGTSGSSTTTTTTTTASGSVDGVLSLFRISPRSKEKSKEKDVNSTSSKTTQKHERSSSQDCMLDSTAKKQNSKHNNKKQTIATTPTKNATTRTSTAFSSSSPQLYIHRPNYMNNASDEQTPPPIPPLPLNYQRSDDESNETRDQKKQRAISKAVRQAELKRLRIAQEIQREQEEIEVQLKELEARGVLIEKALRGEETNVENTETTNNIGKSDEKLLKELLEIWRNITQLKKRDEELGIRQQELQLEHRHAQLKEELNLRLSSNKLDKSSADVAAEGAILNEMLEIVAKRAALRPTASTADLTQISADLLPPTATTSNAARNSLKTSAIETGIVTGTILNTGITTTTLDSITLNARAAQLQENNESNI